MSKIEFRGAPKTGGYYMQSPDIHIVISELTGLYDNLNQRWGNDTCATDVYQVYRQKEYRDVYERLKGVNIESIALKIIADSVSDKVLSRLRELIRDNAQLYETHRNDFNGIDFDKLYPLWEDYLFGNRFVYFCQFCQFFQVVIHFLISNDRQNLIMLKMNIFIFIKNRFAVVVQLNNQAVGSFNGSNFDSS